MFDRVLDARLSLFSQQNATTLSNTVVFEVQNGATLLEIGGSAGVTVEEKVLRPEDLYSADEVFISSTNRSMIAVGEINGRKIASAPGPVIQKLEGVFAEHVREYIHAHASSAGML